MRRTLKTVSSVPFGSYLPLYYLGYLSVVSLVTEQPDREVWEENRAASEDQDREYAKHRLGYLASIIDMRPRYRISRPRASPDIQPYGSACASTLHDCNIMSISCKAISRLPLMEEEGACLKRRIGEPVQLKRIYRYLPFTRSSRGLLMMVRIQISSTVTYLLPVRQR